MRWKSRMFHTKPRRGEAGCAGHILGVGGRVGENREWTLGDVNRGTPLWIGVDRFAAPGVSSVTFFTRQKSEN